MPTRWKITHRFAKGPTVANKFDGYPSLGMQLTYEGDRLAAITHALDVDDRSAEHEVIGESNRRLAGFLEQLRFWHGFRLQLGTAAAERIGAAPDDRGIEIIALPASVAISRRVPLPSESAFSTAPSRLPIWLRLANDARDASDATEAIRNYYMVWEDLKGRPGKNASPPERKLKHVRDFVSHGKVTHDPLLQFLKTEFNRSIDRYDPNDQEQRRYVNAYRNDARQLIEAELERLL